MIFEETTRIEYEKEEYTNNIELTQILRGDEILAHFCILCTDEKTTIIKQGNQVIELSNKNPAIKDILPVIQEGKIIKDKKTTTTKGKKENKPKGNKKA